MLFLLDKLKKEKYHHQGARRKAEMDAQEMARMEAARRRERSASVPKVPELRFGSVKNNKKYDGVVSPTSYASVNSTDEASDHFLSPDEEIVIRRASDHAVDTRKFLQQQRKLSLHTVDLSQSYPHMGKKSQKSTSPVYSQEDLEWDKFHHDLTKRTRGKVPSPDRQNRR